MHRSLRRPRVRPSLVGAAALAALLAVGPSGCGGGEGQPVAQLSLDPGEIDLPYGAYADLDLAWTPRTELAGVAGHLRVFAHLLDSKGRLSRTFDEDLPAGWQVGASQRAQLRIYQSLLAPPLAAGDYTLTAGLYDESGKRWPLETTGTRRGQGEYALVSVHVPNQTPGLPAFEFSPTWSPTLPGADRQVVAFRWLHGEGAIRLTKVASAGSLWARIQIPAVEAAGMRRQLEATADGEEARVALSASCSGFEAAVTGSGSHDVDVPVTPRAGGCRVRLAPNFVMVPQSAAAAPGAGDARRSVLLEVLAWRGAS